MDANLLAMLAYLATGVLAWIPYLGYFIWIAPLVFFFLEKNSSFVRFHCIQSTILYVINALLSLIVGVIIRGIVYTALVRSYYYGYGYGAWGVLSVITVITVLIGIAITVFAIIALIKAYGYTLYKIPLIGKLAEKIAGKLQNANISI
jgi:uncharacterized membrane protein